MMEKLWILSRLECWVRAVLMVAAISAESFLVTADWSPLQAHLMQNYAKTQRPSKQGESVVVHLSTEIRELSLDERHGELSLGLICHAKWTDYRLNWEGVGNQQFQNVPSTFFFTQDIWKPDLILFSNNTRAAASFRSPREKGLLMNQAVDQVVKVDQNGTCSVSVVISATFSCTSELDFVNWPYDSQDCNVNIASWVHEGREVEFKIDGPEEVVGATGKQFGIWEITDARQRVHISMETLGLVLPEVEIAIKMRRLWATEYSTTLLTPTFVVIVLSLANFCGWLRDAKMHGSTAIGVSIVNIVITMAVLSNFRNAMSLTKGLPSTLKFVLGLLVFQPIFMIATRVDRIIGDICSRLFEAPDCVQSVLVQAMCCLSPPTAIVSEVISGMDSHRHDIDPEDGTETVDLGTSEAFEQPTQTTKTNPTMKDLHEKQHLNNDCGHWAAEIFRRAFFFVSVTSSLVLYFTLVV